MEQASLVELHCAAGRGREAAGGRHEVESLSRRSSCMTLEIAQGFFNKRSIEASSIVSSTIGFVM